MSWGASGAKRSWGGSDSWSKCSGGGGGGYGGGSWGGGSWGDDSWSKKPRNDSYGGSWGRDSWSNGKGRRNDSEPTPTKESLENFLKAMVTEFEDADGANGCKDDAHPDGRTTSYFTFAHRTRDTFTEEIMGKNGYYVFSGYDLRPKNLAFEYNNVSEFGANLRYEIPEIARVMKSNNQSKYTMAVPIAASCHEYESYIPMHGDGCGPACQRFDSGATMDQYVQQLFDVITENNNNDGLFTIKEGGQFIGLSFWVWTYDMTYPPMKWFNNLFLPATPSTKVLQILKKELPKLDGRTK